jgi:hypothetical protein
MAVESIETAKKQYAEWFGRPGCLEGNNLQHFNFRYP